MKRVILLALVIAMFAGFANAQPGRIAMYSDAGYSNCTGTLQAVGLVGVYVVHENTGGALVSQFLAVDDPTLPPSIWLTDSFPVGIVASGDTHTGVILSYVTCHSGTFLVATMQYFAQSTTTPCVATRVIPDPASASGTIEVTDCSTNVTTGGGSIFYWNANANCDCTVRAEDSTWGQVKGLYR